LLAYEIYAKDLFSNRVLDLDAGVHLEKPEAAVRFDKELESARTAVSDSSRKPPPSIGHCLPGRLRQGRSGALLDQLLMATLNRAIPVADGDCASSVVSQNLHLDVSGAGQVSLGIQSTIAK
jgi:hypothetical protein